MKQVKSEMAGTLLELKVKKGDKVRAGQEVAVLESMKMEVALLSHSDGVVNGILKSVGDFINEGEAVLELA